MRRVAFLACVISGACGGAPATHEAAAPAPPPSQLPAPADAETARAPSPEPGARELVRELEKAGASTDVNERFRQKTEILRAIRTLADPRGASALHEYATKSAPSGTSQGEHRHFTTLAAFALAEIGDARAIPLLADRLSLDPLSLYDDSQNEMPLKRDDQERVIAARLLGDLGELHSEISPEARETAARGIAAWLKDKPEPHANAMRARARLHIDDATTQAELLAWADPKSPLPKKGAQPPFPFEFSVAQSALRWLGASHHPKAKDVLKKQLKRRPKGFDGTMDGLLLQGSAILGMTLRALASGAAHGLSELGDSQTTSWLFAYIDDDLENEQSRVEACHALAWVMSDRDENALAKRLKAASRPSPKKSDELRLACLLEGMMLKMPDALVPELLGLLVDASSDPLVRMRAAKALGKHGLDTTTESALLAQLEGPQSEEAAVAIALGGSRNAVDALARRAANAKGSWLPAVASAYTDAVRTRYASDLDDGSFFRSVENAAVLATAKIDFAKAALQKSFAESEYDAGPRTLTRVVLRGRLHALARSEGPDQKRAILALEILGERGVLLALTDEQPPSTTNQ